MRKKISLIVVLMFAISLIVLVGSVSYLVNLSSTSVTDSNTITEPNNVTHLQIDNSVSPYDGLVGYWSFDGDNATKAYDWSGNNNDGTYTNGAYSNGTTGVYDNAAVFDGVDDSIRTTLTPEIAQGGNYSYGAWIYPRTLITGKYIFDDYNNGEHYLLHTTNGISMNFYNVSNGVYSPTCTTTAGTLGVNNWYYVMGVYDGSTIKVYINGIQWCNVSAVGYVSKIFNDLSIGSPGSSPNLNFNGSIDDVMIFNKSLTQEEITAIYTNSSTRFKSSGTTTLKQQTLTEKAGLANLTINATEKLLGSNVTGRVAFWDKSAEYKTYNETGYASFDGTTGYVNVSSSSSLNLNSSGGAVSLWIYYLKNTTAGVYSVLFSKNNWSNDRNGYTCYFGSSDSKLVCDITNSTARTSSQATTTSANFRNTWKYVVFTWNDTKQTLYVDGIQEDQDNIATNMDSSSFPLRIGMSANTVNALYGFNGSIDDVMIWNRTLSVSEISDIYNLNRSKYNGSTSGLVSYYSFNSLSPRDDFGNNSGTSMNGVSYSPKNTPSLLTGLVGYWAGDGNANDYSGNGNDGTLVGGANASNSGVFNNSFGFDGTDDSILSNNNLSINNGNFSVNFWVNQIGTINTYAPMVGSSTIAYTSSKPLYSGFGFWRAYSSPTLVYFSVANITDPTNVYLSTSAMTVPLNQWSMLTATYNKENSTARVYLNGVYQTTASNSNITTFLNSTLRLGSDGITKFNGSIDDVMIFNRSLSASEINELYVKGLANWNYSGVSWQNFGNTQLVSGSTTNILPEINLTAGNSTSLFYSPVAWWNVNFSTLNSVVINFSGDTTSTNSTQNWIFANFTIDYEQLVSSTNITLYNTTGLVNSTSTRGINFTNLPNAIYYLNGTVTSTSGIVSTLVTRIIISDNVNSTINITSPGNNTYANNGTINFTANISDNIGIANATLNITDLGGNNWGSFNGVSNYVSSSSVVINSSSTISFWINPLGKGTGGGNYLSLITSSTLTGLSIRQDGTILYYTNNVSGSADNWVTNDGAFNLFDGAWHNFIYNYNGTHKLIYIDSVLTQSRVTTPIGINTPGVNIGMGYNGSMEEIRIYNRSLSSTEISAIYSSGIKRNASLNNTNLVAWYDFEPTSNLTRLVDYSGNGFNGTIIGMNFTNSYSSTTSYSPGITATTVGIVINLVDSVYSWFWKIFDFAGNSVTTSNQNLTVDTLYPNFNFFAPANNSFFNLTSVLFNVTSSTSPNASIVPNLDNSLVSWWRMDDLNSTGGVVDYMGRNNGTTFGATQVTNGKFGKGWVFNGSNGAGINAGSSSSLDLVDNFTISLWLYRVGSCTSECPIYSKYGYTADKGWYLTVPSTVGKLSFWTGMSNYSINSISNLNNNAWYHTTIVFSRSIGATLYLNGINNTGTITGNSSQIVSSSGLSAYIGTRTDALNRVFNGSIDDVMIFNRSLSADEILSLYNATAYNHTETLAQGTHTFNSYIQDFAGNLNQTGAVTFNVDTTFPTLSVETPLNDSYSNSPTNNFNATAIDTANNVSVFMDLDNSLVSWWRMDDLNSTGGVVDYMGRNNGSVSGATQVTNGKFGDAMSFDGVNDYVTMSNSQNLSLPFSISTWINTKNVSVAIKDILRSTNTGEFYLANNKIAFYSPSVTFLSTGTLSIDTWYHIVFQNNGTTTQLYINGLSDKNTTQTIPWGVNTNLFIGGYSTGTSGFNGSIDDVMILNRSLSASEIASLYANSSTKYLNATVSGLSDGVHNYKVYAQDLAGNVNSTATRTLNVDTNYPQISFQNQTPINGSILAQTNLEVNVSSSDLNNNYVATDFDNSLVSWYRMEQGNGTFFADQMGRNNGTCTTTTCPNFTTAGSFGGAYTFDGVNSKIGMSNEIIGNSSFTGCSWINPSDSGEGSIGRVFDNGKSILSMGTSSINFYSDASTAVVISNFNYFNTWSYFCIVRNSTGYANLYLNGVLNNSGSSGIPIIGTTNLFIGGRSSTGRHFNGSIDEVMIFNRSLSAGEISALYNASATKYYNNFTNLANGTHTVKSYIVDKAGNLNSTELRTYTLDNANPSVNLTTPIGNTTSNQSSQNLSVNVSDNVGIQNGTLYVYNQTDNSLVLNQSVTGYGAGKALSFDGVNDSISILDSDNLDLATGFSISTWVKLIGNSGGSFDSIIGKTNGGSSGGGWALYLGAGTNAIGLTLLDGSAPSPLITTNNAIPLNQWIHLVAIWNGSTTPGSMKLYFNGTSQTITESNFGTSTVANNLPVSIGGSTGLEINGSIDEVLIFNRSLNSTEISEIYNSGRGLYANTSIAPFNDGLVAGYHFDNSSGDNSTYFIDITGVNNGTCTTTACPTYVTGKVLSPTETTFNSGIVSTTIGIVIELTEGIYNWFYQFFDWAGNIGTSVNNTLTIDQTYPLIEFDSSNPIDGDGTARTFNITVLINETNIANVTVNFNSTNYVYDFANNASYFVNILGNQYNFSAELGPLGPTEQIDYNVTVTDKAGQQNSTETRLITGNQPPSLVSLAQSPSTNASLDPLVLVEIDATLLDNQDNFESAWLQVTNNSSDWSNLIYNINMTNIGNLTNIVLNASFTLPAYEANISYRIYANDSVGGEENFSIYNISSYYDCTWNVSTNRLDEVIGFYEDKFIGNITLINTGDFNYSINNCSISFAIGYTGFSSSYTNLLASSSNWATGNRALQYLSPVIVSPKSNQTISINASFPSTTSPFTETPSITITSSINDSVTRNKTASVSTALIISPPNPLLYQTIETYPTNYVYLTPGNFSLNAYVRNLGYDIDNSINTTAHNVSFNWTLPSELSSRLAGNETSFYEILNTSERKYNNLTISLTESNLPSMSKGRLNLTIHSYGYKNESDNYTLITNSGNKTLLNETISIQFLCYDTSDRVCVSSCGIGVDPDCVAPTVGSGGSGGGGGGGGAGGSGSFDKSSATFELVRGENQEFDLTLENKLSNPKKDITITVKGNNSQYVIPTPNTINYLGANSKENVRFVINAPSYFASGKYLLEITFTGSIEGNTSTKFTEVKYVTLTILEMKRVVADEYLNSSLALISKMNSSGLILNEVQSILDSMNSNYNSLNFMILKDEARSIEAIYAAATEYTKLKDEINQTMIKSERNGIDTPETKKLFLLAEILFKRGDYVAAYEKMKEAKTSYLLETKGEFKLLYAIKNNPIEALGILISVSAIGLGSGLFIRLRLLKRKLRMLGEEEVLLLQLMRVVQRDCFESNKMSMEEYGESMYQYETRLSVVIQEKVTTETILANLMKLGGKKKALGQEKERLTMLIRQTQDDYMNRGKLDTRIYENMLKTYANRLNKIDEQLVFMEAQEQLDLVSGFWHKLFG